MLYILYVFILYSSELINFLRKYMRHIMSYCRKSLLLFLKKFAMISTSKGRISTSFHYCHIIPLVYFIHSISYHLKESAMDENKAKALTAALSQIEKQIW